MKHGFLLIYLLFFPFIVSGQVEYYSTDSMTSVGITLIDAGDFINCSICQVKQGNEVLKLSPDEVSSYGFKDGRVYLRKEIDTPDSSKKVFMLRLYEGETSLYYYRAKGTRTFYIEQDSSTFFELPRQNEEGKKYYKQLSAFLTDCPELIQMAKLARYRKNPVTKLISRYNSCKVKPFPHFRYGFRLGYEYMKPVPSFDQTASLELFDYSYEGGYSVGLFIDNPILASDFSMRAELEYSMHGYAYNHRIPDEDLDLIINVSTLRTPVSIKYSVPLNKLRPYFNIGLIYAWNFRNESAFYHAFLFSDTILISNELEESVLSIHEMGMLAGCGFEFDLSLRSSLFLEIRLSRLYGLNSNTNHTNSTLSLSSGINF
jgi:hypothetical protein